MGERDIEPVGELGGLGRSLARGYWCCDWKTAAAALPRTTGLSPGSSASLSEP